MKFTKIKRWKIYDTWKSKDNKTGLVSYIQCSPLTPKNLINNNNLYHFCVECTLKFCNKNECNRLECTRRINYNSLNYNKTYEDFNSCEAALLEWHKHF